MTTRILPPDEWSRLAQTEAGPVWQQLDPSTTAVLVIEQDGQLIASWAVMAVPHLECLWIDPAHRRKGAVARRLWATMREYLLGRGIRRVLTSAVTDEVRTLIGKLHGTRLPGETYVIPIDRDEEPPTCQP